MALPESARVLVVVKATPQPSAKYGDTVCVAGIRIDVQPYRWIRLYPVPFRWMPADGQFAKYDIIEASVRRRTQDSRPESYVPDVDSIRVVEKVEGWPHRGDYLGLVPTTTTCALMAAAAARHDAPSLGLIRVAILDGIELEDHLGWSAEERAKIAQSMSMSELDLFGSPTKPPALRAPRLKLRYRYRCQEAGCPGHQGQNLDWELTAFQNRHARVPMPRLREMVEDRFGRMMFDPKRSTAFYMGNFEAAIKRSRFSVLGTYYPPVEVASKQPLF
ncbi:hypothetical protein ACH3VR_14070 [Microbacterium sp. B2969]|uniref:Uncharacterized protein n=1 Tax=Microbacterium alkaliflavum TaxID=3248839 RepID=A0ABW7Q9E5_9MICO